MVSRAFLAVLAVVALSVGVANAARPAHTHGHHVAARHHQKPARKDYNAFAP